MHISTTLAIANYFNLLAKTFAVHTLSALPLTAHRLLEYFRTTLVGFLVSKGKCWLVAYKSARNPSSTYLIRMHLAC